jgi:hypothetical protein
MRSKIFFTLLLFLTTVFYTNAQNTEPKDTTVKPQTQTTKKDDEYVRPDSKKRFRCYVKSIVGPMAFARTTVSAGFSTWRNSPHEWGEKWEGFGRRFASGLGKSAIKNTTQFGLDESFKLDSAFYRSKKPKFGGRLADALASPFVARDTKGKKVFGFPRVVGTYTANIFAAETWYPSRYTYKDGLKSGTISLGFTAAFNVFKEFFRKK